MAFVKHRLEQLERDIARDQEMSADQQRLRRQESLNSYREQIHSVETLLLQVPDEVGLMENHASRVKEKIRQLEAEFGVTEVKEIGVGDYQPGETA